MNKANDIEKFNSAHPKELAQICVVLKEQIEEVLKKATSKIYYSFPVWFIDGRPVVGYYVKKKTVTLLFWSGQLFEVLGLSPIGKFKAAKISYTQVNEVDVKLLKKWLAKSKTAIWDYPNIKK